MSSRTIKQNFKVGTFLIVAGSIIQPGLVAAQGGFANWTTALSLSIAIACTALLVWCSREVEREIVEPLDWLTRQLDSARAGDPTSAAAEPRAYSEVAEVQAAALRFCETRNGLERSNRELDGVVTALGDGLKGLAEGDLTCSIDRPISGSSDTLRQTFNRAVKSLAEVIREVSRSTATVAIGAAQIRAASSDLAASTVQQANRLGEAAAAVNRITANARVTATEANDVQSTIGRAQQEGAQGDEVVRKAIAAMAAIEQGAGEIAQIINVIDGIAFQTNLLALNAGVEAARAGDAGKGFAVVANEVRALAQRSADAAKTIKDLIGASTQQVSGGVALVGETGVLLEKIVGQIAAIDRDVAGIACSAKDQASDLEQVNTTIAEIDRVVQQTAAMVEETTAAACSLDAEGAKLKATVSQFRTGDEAVVLPFVPPVRVLAAPRVPAPVSPPRLRTARATGNYAVKTAPKVDADDWSEF